MPIREQMKYGVRTQLTKAGHLHILPRAAERSEKPACPHNKSRQSPYYSSYDVAVKKRKKKQFDRNTKQTATYELQTEISPRHG